MQSMYSICYNDIIFLQEFADNLFNLFDTDGSGSISLQELMGGMGRLLRYDSHFSTMHELHIYTVQYHIIL